MAKYVLWGTYCDNVEEKRAPHRQAHLDGLKVQKEVVCWLPLDLPKIYGRFLQFTTRQTRTRWKSWCKEILTGKTASGQSMKSKSGFRLFNSELVFKLKTLTDWSA